MQHYEMLFIIKNDFSDTEAPAILKQIVNQISSLSKGAEIISSDLIGRKRLAYPINKEASGIYALVDFRASSADLGNMNREFELNDSVVRHLITKKVEKTPEQTAREEKLKAKALQKEADKRTEERRTEVKSSQDSKQLVQKKEELEKSTPEESVEKLEEKLDEILKRDIVE